MDPSQTKAYVSGVAGDSSKAFILQDDGLRLVNAAIAVQIDSEANLSDEELAQLSPSSIAYTAGWQHAWQKKNDGTWATMI